MSKQIFLKRLPDPKFGDVGYEVFLNADKLGDVYRKRETNRTNYPDSRLGYDKTRTAWLFHDVNPTTRHVSTTTRKEAILRALEPDFTYLEAQELATKAVTLR